MSDIINTINTLLHVYPNAAEYSLLQLIVDCNIYTTHATHEDVQSMSATVTNIIVDGCAMHSTVKDIENLSFCHALKERPGQYNTHKLQKEQHKLQPSKQINTISRSDNWIFKLMYGDGDVY